MLKQSSPPRLKAQPCKPAQLRALVKHSEESPPMRLEEAAGYFSSRLPRAFRVIEGVDSPKGSEGVQLAKGDIFIVCLKKAASFLKLKSESACVTVPFDTRTEFALTPLSEEDNDAAVKSWEGEFHSVTEFFEARKSQNILMPAALKVLTNVLDHGRRKVLARTILFNIRQITQRVGLQKRYGIEGVDCSGLVHRFLEDGDPLHFSTKLFDTRCSPVYFANVLNFPQTARVYLHPSTDGEEEEEETKLLPNLSTTTITEVTHDHHLVVRKLSDDGNQLGPTFTVPLNACLKVVAIKLKDSALLDSISDQRCIGRATSSHSVGPTASLADMHMNPYSDDPTKATRGGIQVGKKGDQETYYNEDSARRVRHHAYVNVKGPVAFVPVHASSDLDDDSDVYVYMEGPKVTTGAPRGKKVSPDHGNPTQLLAVPYKYWKNGNGVAGLGYPPVTARTAESHHLPHSNSQKLQSMQDRGIDAHPTELQLFHHVARRLGAYWKRFAIYLGFEDARIQQADSIQSLEYKAFNILVTWLKGSGNTPKSWATILAALETAELSELACEIVGHIEGGTLYCSTPWVK